MPPSQPSIARFPPRPLANAYWVDPGRLLAGEYPGAGSGAETADRIQRLLQAGVNSFVDLTEEGELAPYDALLRQGSDIHYLRRPIVDHSVAGPRQMAETLDTIAAELASGRCVYVHCRAGIGRTGTTVACHLIRNGLHPDAALDRLQELWQQSARSRSWPSVPETDEQVRFVLDWREAAGLQPVSTAARCEGAMIGLALGEALATNCVGGVGDIVEVSVAVQRAAVALVAGPHTAMTRDAAESLLARQGHDAADQMQRYLQSTRGVLANATWPAEFKRALASWQWSRKPNTGSHDPANLDAHSLPRCLASALYRRVNAAEAIELAVATSRPTQQSPTVLDACRLWTAALVDALSGTMSAASSWNEGAAMATVRARVLRKDLEGIVDGRLPAAAAQNTEDNPDVVSALVRALAAFRDSRDFESGMRCALKTPAAITVGALYGSIAGAHYGVAAIPEAWRRALSQRQELSALAGRFA
jgi:ADP-ribosylglycohydrolase